MSDATDRERVLKLQLMEVQIMKAHDDMRFERRKFILQCITAGLSAAGVVIAAFAAGHFIR